MGNKKRCFWLKCEHLKHTGRTPTTLTPTELCRVPLSGHDGWRNRLGLRTILTSLISLAVKICCCWDLWTWEQVYAGLIKPISTSLVYILRNLLFFTAHTFLLTSFLAERNTPSILLYSYDQLTALRLQFPLEQRIEHLEFPWSDSSSELTACIPASKLRLHLPLPKITTWAYTIFEMVIPIDISNGDLPLGNLWDKLYCNMAVLAHPNILGY